jgi:hypothetical protein
VIDVTSQVQEQMDSQGTMMLVHNGAFGKDPAPNIKKHLKVTFTVDGVERMRTVAEEEYLNIGFPYAELAGPTFARLNDAHYVSLDPTTVAFVGWVPRNRKVAIRLHGQREAFVPKQIYAGNEVSKLWAQQMLAQGEWRNKKQVLAFSLKYQVPSNTTALLAVPQEEMKLFRQKEKEWQKVQQANARREREWARQRQQNWNRSRGGDPEIRVAFDNAKSVDAMLPDGRVIPLTYANGYWGGNFEIPVTAAEGEYKVRIIARLDDGNRIEREIEYQVDRTKPAGTARVKVVDGVRVLEVVAEPKLNEVIAYLSDGTKLKLTEVEPGKYRISLPKTAHGTATVLLKDDASNKLELVCEI